MADQRELPLAFPEISPEAPLIPVRMVNEYVYCPRLAYLMWVQAEWADSADTVEGRIKHKRVDAGGGALPEEPEEGERIHARSVSLSSLKLGITAKLDLVEGEGSYVTPVDYKRGKRPHVDKGAYDPERVHNIDEWQEALQLRFTGGYGSVFGDGSPIAVDLCQHCVKELLGPYCRVDS